MRTTLFKHVSASAAAVVTVVLVSGAIASAHLEADPLAMQAGTSGTVAFNVEHGCDGSPMIDLKIQIPQGVTGVTAVDKAGWTAKVTADAIEFSGGSLDAATEDHFDVNLTVPTLVGAVYFPAIETCAKGELAWIEIPAAGAPEPELPAPSLKVTEGPPTSADLTPVPEVEEDESTTAATGTADIGVVVAPTTIDAATADDSSNTGTIVVVVVVVAVVLIGGGIVLARRRTPTARG
jgi:periplasmic copper chaperone A